MLDAHIRPDLNVRFELIAKAERFVRSPCDHALIREHGSGVDVHTNVGCFRSMRNGERREGIATQHIDSEGDTRMRLADGNRQSGHAGYGRGADDSGVKRHVTEVL